MCSRREAASSRISRTRPYDERRYARYCSFVATRLHYALPIAKHFILSTAARLRPGGLPGRLPAPTRNEPFFIVTGAGRSGTSAVTRVLHESGIRMGSDFDAPSQYNATGYYQERAVYIVNEEMLAEMGMAGFEGATRWASRSTVLAVAEGYRARLAEIAGSDTDGWKDPIFSATLEAWLPYLPARPKLIVCLRSPAAYAASVMNIYGLVDTNVVMRQWARHYRRLLDVIRDHRLEATCVEYDALIAQPEETVAALSRFVGRPLQAHFVEAPLRRFEAPIPERYGRLYDEVLALAPDAVRARAGTTASRRRERTAMPAEDYLRRAEEVTAGVRKSREACPLVAAMPRPALNGAARDQAAAYGAALCEAQEALAALEPPAPLGRYHELTVREVNQERILAELFVAALRDGEPDQRMVELATQTWRRFVRPEALERSARERAQERERALRSA